MAIPSEWAGPPVEWAGPPVEWAGLQFPLPCPTFAFHKLLNAARHQQCWWYETRESETAVIGHRPISITPATRMSTEGSSTLSGLLSLYSSKHAQLLYIAICI